MATLITSEEEKEKVERKKREAAKERKRVVKAVMSTPEGRKFVWKLIADAEVFQSSFISDPALMQWHSGRRDLGLKYLAEVDSVCPELFKLAQEENKPETDEVNNGR